ncbi:MAG: hypothetical protein WBE75_02985 [Candidatus Omnitrophota bacterium]|jgi:chromosome segregation ATPase
MDTFIVLLIIILLSSGAGLLLFPHKHGRGGKKKEKPRADNPLASEKEGLASVKNVFERQIKGLRVELEKANDDYQVLHDEMEKELGLLRRQEAESQREIQRLKGWGDKEKGELDKLRKENHSLQSRFLQTQKDAEREFSSNLALRRDALEKEKHLQELSGKNKELADKLRESEKRADAARKTAAEQEKELAIYRKSAEESEWISKAEHTRLYGQLKEKTEELDRLKAGLK